MVECEITDIPGIEIGHAQDLDAATGCTVVLCRDGAMTGVDVRGGSPGTRETDALDSVNLRESVHGILLAGGSAFGLDAAAGVMQALEEQGVGRDVGVCRVPIVCGAILFDLLVGDHRVRPDKAMGYEAAKNARGGKVLQGSVGAGTGATVGKIAGLATTMKGGFGTSCFRVGDLLVGAAMAVNCVGDVIDPGTGRTLAGLLNPDLSSMGSTEDFLLEHYDIKKDLFSGGAAEGNTIIGVVATNALLTKPQANKLASISHDGIARVVRPSHSVFDGDTVFTMATGEVAVKADAVSILAVRAVGKAIINAITSATSLHGVPSYTDLQS